MIYGYARVSTSAQDLTGQRMGTLCGGDARLSRRRAVACRVMRPRSCYSAFHFPQSRQHRRVCPKCIRRGLPSIPFRSPERVWSVTLRSPNLNVLHPENRAEMPGIAHFLEDGFKARDKEGKLLLPDLSALSNTTVGIFSDYAGESTGNYLTYSFLVCAFGSLGAFQQQMAALRMKASIGHKEIAFKDFGMGQLRRMLPRYLRLVDQYVSGLAFTLVVDKSIPSLFGPGPETLQRSVATLREHGYGNVVPKVAEKLFRVVHTIAFLLALLGHQGQKIFWMTDHDAIGETPEKHKQLLAILNGVLPLYTTKSFSLLGGARPFQPRAFEYLDLLSLSLRNSGSEAESLEDSI
jgi:hypothetical protein